MPLISTVSPDNATGPVKAVFDSAQQAFGMVPSALQLLAISPHQLESQFHNIGYYASHPNLSPKLLAMVRMLLAHTHNCSYCVDMNSALLVQSGLDSADLEKVRKNPFLAPLPEREKEMLLLILMAVNRSTEVNNEDLDVLRKHGYSDQDILDGIAHGANALALDLILNVFKLKSEIVQTVP